MLSFGVTIPATVPQRSEIPEGLMNYSAYKFTFNHAFPATEYPGNIPDKILRPRSLHIPKNVNSISSYAQSYHISDMCKNFVHV